MKRLISLILAITLVFGASFAVNAVDLRDQVDDLIASFKAGEGPKANGTSIDYMYFSPVGRNDNKKYPLVIYVHGMGDGSKPGEQINKHYIAFWASDEFQNRFGSVDGAFILAPRSHEESGNFWGDDLIVPLRTAIDDFIAKNKKNIDLSRIYIGGYSMGGKMVYNMAVAYPEMFAAIFPICPALSPSTEQFKYIKDIPVWLTSCRNDPIVNYGLSVKPGWERLCSVSTVASKCRFTTLESARMGDGSSCPSNHHAWFAVENDMFAYNNGAYPQASTVDGTGKSVTLTSPNGMISWLYSHTSDFDGATASDMGNLENSSTSQSYFAIFFNIIEMIIGFVKSIISMFLK